MSQLLPQLAFFVAVNTRQPITKILFSQMDDQVLHSDDMHLLLEVAGFASHLNEITQGQYKAEKIILKTLLLIGGMAKARSVIGEERFKKILSVCSNVAK